MKKYRNNQPTLKTWLRINGGVDASLSSSLFQNRRVRQLQIQEAIASPNRYDF